MCVGEKRELTIPSDMARPCTGRFEPLKRRLMGPTRGGTSAAGLCGRKQARRKAKSCLACLVAVAVRFIWGNLPVLVVTVQP